MKDILNKIIDNESVSWMRDDNYRRVIFFSRHGSMAYGTNTPESDEDFRGVAIAPKRTYLGINSNFEQLVRNDPDAQIFEIKKFINLAYNCNPNILEVLFTDPSDHLVVTKLGQILIDNKELFISKFAKSRFLGYARQQAHRIKNHKRWMNNEIKEPSRSDFNLPEVPVIKKQDKEVLFSKIQKTVDSWNMDMLPFNEVQKIYLNDRVADILTEMKITSDSKWEAAARTLGLNENFIKILIAEKEFDSKAQEFKDFKNWEKNRNPQRFELEKKYGFDTKHGLHLVRLLRMAKEILLEGKVIVRRPDAEELLSIRRGAWSYEKLIEYSDSLEKEINSLYSSSKIRSSPDLDKINDLCMQLIEFSFSGE